MVASPKFDYKGAISHARKSEELLALHLNAHGIEAIAPPPVTGMPTAWYTQNQVDVLVYPNSLKLHLEVKVRDIRFTSPKDFPYPDLHCETVSGWQSKRVKPIAIAAISSYTQAVVVAIAPELLREQVWFEKSGYDPERQTKERWLAIKKEGLITFSKFVQILEKIKGESNV